MIALFVIVTILGSTSAQNTTMKSTAPAPGAGAATTLSPLEMSICETLKPKESPGLTFIY